MNTVARLVANKQPLDSEWETVDISTVILSMLQAREISTECMLISGKNRPWDVCPGYVSLVFENLLKNSIEAYGRNDIALPEKPVEVTIYYEHMKIEYKDFAGGIDLSVGNIFEPYSSSKGVYTNNGLGLAQAKTAMEVQHYGIELGEEQPENGALFILDFNRNFIGV